MSRLNHVHMHAGIVPRSARHVRCAMPVGRCPLLVVRRTLNNARCPLLHADDRRARAAGQKCRI